MNAVASPVWQRTYDGLTTRLYADGAALGLAAADDLATILKTAAHAKGEASVIVATGNSQLRLMEALSRRDDIPWSQVRVFHMDEYCGMSDDHPASFRLYIRRNLTDHVHPLAFHGLAGDAADLNVEMARYAALLRQHPADVCVMGIGENGHLAFNDPPADFETTATVHIVTLDLACRRQQVGEGHFRTIDDVPRQAMTLTVPALVAPPHLLVVVPEERKAEAVRSSLEGSITPMCPASILRRQPRAVLYLDPGSASLLR
jgi:glucosamine-6-phosphate deaminase